MVFFWFVWKIRKIKSSCKYDRSHLNHLWNWFYILADWRVRPLVLYIKKWARFHDINDASKATISSYSLCLMLIHYLQCKSSWSPFIHEPCLFFLAMSVSLVKVYACLQVLSRSDYLILQISGAIFVVIIVFLFICRCLFSTGASLLTGTLPCESIKSVVNVIHV